MKIVLDTNVLISALFWHGPPHKLLRLIETGNLTLCITFPLLEELCDVLSRPFFSSFIKKYNTSCEELIAAVFEIAKLYSDKGIGQLSKMIRMMIECYLALLFQRQNMSLLAITTF